MKLLLVNYEYPPVGGGAGNATHFLGQALAGLGHRICVLTSAYAGLPVRENVGDVEVIRVPAARRQPDRGGFLHMALFGLRARSEALRLAATAPFDGVITFFTIPCAHVGAALRTRSGTPFLVSLRGGDVPGLVPGLRVPHWLLTPYRRRLLRLATAVVANDSGLAELSQRTDPTLVRVIPNGVDTDFFTPALFPRSPVPFRFLFVGRFHSQKQLTLLLCETAALARTSTMSFRLILVGDGPQRSQLEQMAATLGIAGYLEWHGWQAKENLLQFYHNADAFLNPSAYEGLPNTVLEAMACGLPVIASNIPGNLSLVQPGRTGLLFDLAEPAGLRKAMQSLLLNRAGAIEMGIAGRNRARAEFSWEHTARQYLRLFHLP